MSRKLLIVVALFFLQFSSGWAQLSEIECTVLRRAGINLTLVPVYFDPEVLPKPGDKVHLLLLVKSDLPPGKSEGYYELFTMQVIKVVPESKSIIFRCDEDMEAARAKTGMPNINLNSESLVRIAW